ncbi:MAG: adenylate/guanylate cyclase domain-containing protein [Anaerolineales bacterium]
MKEIHFHWQWDLKSDPEAFWPFISDTDRVNADSGLSVVRNQLPKGQRLENANRRLRVTMYGVPLEYDETPFEWLRPVRYGVHRSFKPSLLNPLRELRFTVELTPRPGGGTHLDYRTWATPSSPLGRIAIPIQIGFLTHRALDRAIRRYDATAAQGGARLDLGAVAELAPGGRERLLAARDQLIRLGQRFENVDRLVHAIQTADDGTAARLRPYKLADRWGEPRREVLELCLWATRAGLLDFEWDLLCPHCRNARFTADSLQQISSKTVVNCATCNVDFTANLEHSVELTFHPNPAIRPVIASEFCVAGPQVTPHIVLQQLLKSGEKRTLTPALEPGRYRFRAMELSGTQTLLANDAGRAETVLRVGNGALPAIEHTLTPHPTLHLLNAAERPHLFILERTQWGDQATLAADVTALQVFRDLFANEAIRAGEQVSVGSMTILFTDLRGSTKLYREIGDAPAFALVMSHFDVLKDAITAESGAIVKNIGDAVMAVFRHPVFALRAIVRAQRTLAMPPRAMRPLMLKVGIHYGPCIGVNLNDRFDYFGSTVNAASRLVELSNGDDVVLSASVRNDPEVLALLADPATGLTASPVETTLKGFDDERFEIWRVQPA